LKSYYRKDLDRVFKECGFEILSAEPILLSKEVLRRAKTMAWNKSALRQEILSKYGGYPASIDVIARPI
jgi:hypothetical protein